MTKKDGEQFAMGFGKVFGLILLGLILWFLVIHWFGSKL